MPSKNYPIRMSMDDLKKRTARRDADRKESNRKAKALQKGAVERGNREQAREAESLKKLRELKRKKMARGGNVKRDKAKKRAEQVEEYIQKEDEQWLATAAFNQAVARGEIDPETGNPRRNGKDKKMGRGVVKKRKGGKVMSGCGGKVKKMAYGGKVKKMAHGGKVKKMAHGGKVHKMAGGGGVYGPTDGGSGGGSGGSGGRYRLKDLGAAPSAGRGSGNTTIRPSLRGGMPGVKVKSKFSKGGKVKKMAKGGKVNHKGCGIAKRGLTKGRMV